MLRLHKAQHRNQHYGSERSQDLHMMCHWKPRTGHIPDLKKNQNRPKNIYFCIFTCWKFRHTKHAQTVWVNRSGDWSHLGYTTLKSWCDERVQASQCFQNETVHQCVIGNQAVKALHPGLRKLQVHIPAGLEPSPPSLVSRALQSAGPVLCRKWKANAPHATHVRMLLQWRCTQRIWWSNILQC